MTDSTQDPLRGTGRTTNRIITLVRTAIANPGVRVNCKDHENKEYNHSYVTDKVGEILTVLSIPYKRVGTAICVYPLKKKEQNDS